MSTKPKVATASLAGCFGCHMSLLDIDERILKLIELIEALEEIDDVFDLRALLEPRMLAHSAPLLTAQDYAEIAALDAAFASAIAAQDVAQWGQLNARFHLALYRHARQPRTLAIVTSLLQTSDRFTRLQMNRAPALSRAAASYEKIRSQHRQATAHLAGHYERSQAARAKGRGRTAPDNLVG